MIINTSALVAVLDQEPETDWIARAIATACARRAIKPRPRL